MRIEDMKITPRFAGWHDGAVDEIRVGNFEDKGDGLILPFYLSRSLECESNLNSNVVEWTIGFANGI